MPAGGGTSQTAVVRAAGGRSQLVSLVTAAVAALTMLVAIIVSVISLAPRVVVLDMSRAPDIEYSALQMLLDTDRRAAAKGLEWAGHTRRVCARGEHRRGERAQATLAA
jgi:MFS superfamily sulfate permease-like transporter